MTADPVTAAFAESLRRLRAEQGLSKAALAALAEVHPASIANVENGTFGATLSTAGRIARALGTTLPAMLTGVPDA